MTPWIPGNSFELLENGEEFFPRVFDAIATARVEVIVETFILFEDKVGLALRDALVLAARAGARVDLTIDGFGSPDLSAEFIASLTDAGVRMHVFDAGPKLLGLRTNLLRRMHRKIVVVDSKRAFVGGINYSADHLGDFGPESKQDYAVEIQGPLVADIRSFVLKALARGRENDHARSLGWFARLRGKMTKAKDRAVALAAAAKSGNSPPPAGDALGLLACRDNRKHRNDIERHYRIAIRAARHRVVIANAYFFPGWRLLREMRKAARRGVEVSLILQGRPDMPIVKVAAGLLYRHLISAGVRVYEYGERPLHGKVALSDDSWSTVGSSNLDPLSLSLNLEANVIIKDRAFNAALYERLDRLMRKSCTLVQEKDLPPAGLWDSARGFFIFHLLRHYPSWMGWLPAHAPSLSPAERIFAASNAKASNAKAASDKGSVA